MVSKQGLKQIKRDYDDLMIISLTSGIGPILGRETRSSFYEIADRLHSQPVYAKQDSTMKQWVVDMLALSVFYTTVVVPLECGNSFYDIAAKAGATHVRIGSDKITKKWTGMSVRIVNDFQGILRKLRIPIGLLSFSTLRQFTVDVVSLCRKRENEAMD